MSVIQLDALDLFFAATLVLGLAGLSTAMKLKLTRSLLIAALRTTVQLLLIGLVLKALFANRHIGWLALIAAVMLVVAGYEVRQRQAYRLSGWWSFGAGTVSIFVSAFSVTVFALTIVIGPKPWYDPQYAIPLLGMMLGNTMTAVALSTNHLTNTLSKQRNVVEARLVLGHAWTEATAAMRRDSIHVGMIPTINAMAVAGIVSLPGMMTGQILAGHEPTTAVMYQILVMFLIAVTTGVGAILSVWFVASRLFDERHRLRLDRLDEGHG